MSTAVINIKVNKDLKYEAQTLAEELGLSLSALINICLKKIVRTRVIELNAAEEPSDYMIKALKESKEDIKADRVSPSFEDAESAIKWLNDPNKKYVNEI